jgi:amino acid adenylation domain-containing protein
MTSAAGTPRFTDAVPQLHDYLIHSARRLGDKVALVCGGERLTYRDLDDRSNALAHALVRRDIRRGDRVLIYSDNTVESVVAFWGVLKANAVASVISSSTRPAKLAHLLNDCQAAGLITDARHTVAFAEAASRAAHLRVVIVSGPVDRELVGGLPGVAAWNEAVVGEPTGGAPARLNVDIDLAAIIYTSGSTGVPKGVMLTHRNMLTAAASITAYLGNVEDDVIVSVLPLSFDYGLYQMIMAFRMGARLVLERSFAYPVQVLGTMAAERVTGFPGVPTVFATLAEMKTLAGHDLSSVRYVTNTAAALAPKHLAFLRAAFPSARIYSMYGLTECKRCTYLPPEDIERKPGSVGIAIPNTEIWIVDEDGRRVEANRVGQLVVRGATVMRGYWGNPEATARRLRPGPLPGETVLYTGDACRLDEEGYLYFVGRMDDVIKSRGEKVAPREVEAALLAVPGVKEAAVIGVPDDILGEAIKAYIVREAGSALTEKRIQRECQRQLESFMVPKYVVFVPDLPRTSTGKIARKELL